METALGISRGLFTVGPPNHLQTNDKVLHQLHPSSSLTFLPALPLLQWLPLQVQELQTTSRMLSCWPSFWHRWKASIEKIHLLKFFCWSFSVVAGVCVCVCVRCKVFMNNSFRPMLIHIHKRLQCNVGKILTESTILYLC